MYMRALVAVLDFNYNVNRGNKLVDGEETYRLKVIYLSSPDRRSSYLFS